MAEPSSLQPEYQNQGLLLSFEVAYLNPFPFRTRKGTDFSKADFNHLELKLVKTDSIQFIFSVVQHHATGLRSDQVFFFVSKHCDSVTLLFGSQSSHKPLLLLTE